MNTSCATMNGYVVPSEIVCEILQRTDCHLSLQFVCKAFATHFFAAFFQACESSPSLKGRLVCIELDHPKFSNTQKIKTLYEGLRKRIEHMSGYLSSEDKASQEEQLKLKGVSLEELYRLDSWLEDIGLFEFFKYDEKSVGPLKGKKTSIKAEEIRQWFSANKTKLHVVKDMSFYVFPKRLLAQLPKEIGLFTQLQKLSLAEHGLKILPKEIGQLHQLQELYLYTNLLTSFPIEICNLSQLQILDFGNNGLTSLPKEIGNLRRLQKLYLYTNKLACLPEEICNLNQLQKLYLYENQLSSLPNKISHFKHLEKLQLANNKLTNLPKEISSLNQLSVLVLQDNQFTSLPEEMENLSQLQELDIRKNPFTSLPQWVKRLIEAGVVLSGEE